MNKLQIWADKSRAQAECIDYLQHPWKHIMGYIPSFFHNIGRKWRLIWRLY
jgi:hypothetical protein